MQVQECYELFGGSYEDVKERLLKDELIRRLVIKFLADPSYQTLEQAMSGKNYGDAFRAVHTLKGVSQNLSFDCLSTSTHLLTEELRHWEDKPVEEEKCKQLFEQVTTDYNKIVDAINKMAQSE